MSIRINGKTFRSACDIEILMESRDLAEKLDTPEAREARIQKYAERFEQGLPIFDEDDTVITEDDELSLIADADDEYDV